MITEKLIKNWLLDLKKQKINHFERAELINVYLKENNVSIRQLAKELDIPKSTLQDWCMWNRLSKEQYSDLVEKGYKDTEIYNMLRSQSKLDTGLSSSQVDIIINECIEKLKSIECKVKKQKCSLESAKVLHNLSGRIVFLLSREE